MQIAVETPAPIAGHRRPETLELVGWERCGRRLEFRFGVGEHVLRKRYTYDDVDFEALERRFGREAMERIYFHVAAFETIPLAALRPRTIDFGDLRRFITPELEALWRQVLRGVGAQWRYENGLPVEPAPVWAVNDAATAAPRTAAPIAVSAGPVAALCFNGGGKDSLVMMRLLERAGIDYATLGYSHSTYGGARRQHDLIDDLGSHCRPRRRHRQWVEDDQGSDPAALAREFGVRTPICAETPISLFAALPLALAHGYRWLVLGNERSADEGNFHWPATGEEVNHQWGKSSAAERLLDRYIGRHLVEGLRYFSLLRPIHDVVIFGLLRGEADAVRSTHSCSVAKPWCERCPKCAYVWAGYQAYLDPTVTAGMFRGNLFDRAENQAIFRALLGLGSPKPFECVGEIGETRLAFALCRARGLPGRALDLAAALEPNELDSALDRYTGVYTAGAGLPEAVERAVEPLLYAGARAARDHVERHLSVSRSRLRTP